ncbi:MAG TPA: histidine kinase dimerization/phospho-acceptor domain-containing protein, partial [Ohtaekwangia sp.]|nr:histidine kinase dimerization/phospho-acceptor domain-containing protein [Ohtaekwangia sp.]
MKKTFVRFGFFFALTNTYAQGGAAPSMASDGATWGWIVAALLSLSLAVCLLHLIRTRRVMRRRVDDLQSDLMRLYDRAPCGYHSTDERGIIVGINQTLLSWLGYFREEVVDKLTFTDLVGGGESADAAKVIALVEGRISSPVHCQLTRKDGETFPVIVKDMSFADLGGRGHQKLFSTIDNSECYEALERIKNLDQELESFSYSISHDLRAPLRSIDGYSKILQEDYAGQLGEEGKRVMKVIMNNAQRMGNLIDDLLEFGRLGRKTLQRSEVDMTGMVNNIVHELLLDAGDRKVNVKVGDMPTACADADMIRQVWMNLLGNAFKFTSKNETAHIEVGAFTMEDGAVCYKVQDNGVGFDMKYASKLFGVFQRLHKIQDFTGTG